MDERYMKITIAGFLIGMVIFLWLGIKVLGNYEVVDPDKMVIQELPIEPESLIDVIEIKQNRHIKKSHSDLDCYTSEHLEDLKNSDKLIRLKENLSSNDHFLEIVSKIHKLSKPEWNQLRQQALDTHSPTWEEQKKVGPPGQTKAGQEGEKLVAKSIVELVTELKNC
jgi:hypothetical protein